MTRERKTDAIYDYILVGSGAGGGPLAARLAEAGKKVLVIEAGSDHQDPKDAEAREVSRVPSFHGVSTEHEALSWQFFVKHYEQPEEVDSKLVEAPESDPLREQRTGIFYPRAAALGGCTVHNAMITIAGPDSDWDELAELLEDPSWRAQSMRPHFQRLERNEYLKEAPPEKPPSWIRRRWSDVKWLVFGKSPAANQGRHGFRGWLHTSLSDISIGLRDKQLVKMLKGALRQARREGLEGGWTLVSRFLKGRIREHLDPNHARTQSESPEGVVLIPQAIVGAKSPPHHTKDRQGIRRGNRSSPRELLLQAKSSHPDSLDIWPNCLATRVLFDDGETPRAVGIELLRGEKLYRAHPQPSQDQGERERVFVRNGGEVILCGGAFNTPQLLMLSGIGDEAHLKDIAGDEASACVLHDRDGKPLTGSSGEGKSGNRGDDKKSAPRRISLPGVGRNLQDRYEVTLISEMKRKLSLLEGAEFRWSDASETKDRHLREWRESGGGLYASNGAVLGIFKRSKPDLPQPDLFIFGIPLPFKGYAPKYSEVGELHTRFTWAILKSHTKNHDGRVRLRTSDPRDTPDINFHYFNERTSPGKSDDDPDLHAIVEGVKFVRGIAKKARFVVKGEHHPERLGSDEKEIRSWIKREAWGHHACGTCRMGPDGDALAVLDSRFRVRGVDGLRVVDASIFPKIPGYFIVTNIYMASEKAAQVVLEDSRARAFETHSYPRDLHSRELEAIRVRRKVAAQPEPGSEDPSRPWSRDVTGLAISGGGIRSATLNLGVLQSLAKGGWLERCDFLSTVSGGSYIGTFLGRCFDRLRGRKVLGGDGDEPDRPPCESVRRTLTDRHSPPIQWLRRHGNYIAPSGKGDSRLNLATFLRNFLSVHFVVGMFLLAGFGLANLIRYFLFDKVLLASNFLRIGKGDLPIGHLMESWLGPFFSPWFALCELLLLFLVLPRIIAYWLVSQDRHERYQWPTLFLLFLFGSVLLYVGVHDELDWEPVFLGLAVFSSFVPVILTWRRGKRRERAVGTGGVETQRLRTRNYLTYDLGLYLGIGGVCLGFAIIDTLGHGLQQWLVEKNVTYAEAFAAIFSALVALIPIVRIAASLLAGERDTSKPPSTIKRILQKEVFAGVLAAALFTAPLVFYSFASHAVFQGGSAIWIGALSTGFAILVSWVLSQPAARTFVNRSSLAQAYSARLARSYLGASNPLRQRREGANITEVMPGDDVAAIPDYRPHEAGGPFHLINVTVNQTVDFDSLRGHRDRKGESAAVSSVGLSVGERWHCAWGDGDPASPVRKSPRWLVPLGWAEGDDHPLVDIHYRHTRQAEMLSLRQWMAISGAAIGPGRGQGTELGTALLFGLANLRTGQWWDSGLSAPAKWKLPNLSLPRRILYSIPKCFPTQSLLLYEWVARYAGPWERYWYLSDGGFFENLGAYELIRRRVPRIILSDAGADPRYELADFAELVRKARIDFGASIESLTAAELDRLVKDKQLSQEQRKHLGTVDELRLAAAEPGRELRTSSKHAALCRVRYEDGSASLLLYFKATVTGDEPTDVAHYRTTHPEFPHESTADQFFDEAQWESYRRLGEHIAEPLVSDMEWFWKIDPEGGQ
ncbi:MAG: GMC oxidoreductase [Planctomycetota bacterium]